MNVEELVNADISEIIRIEGFDEDIAQEIQNRAAVFIETRLAAKKQKCEEIGLDEELLSLESLSADALAKLGEAGVKTLDDFADLASDELLEIIGPHEITQEEANELIMAARAHWFEDEALSTDNLSPEQKQ